MLRLGIAAISLAMICAPAWAEEPPVAPSSPISEQLQPVGVPSVIEVDREELEKATAGHSDRSHETHEAGGHGELLDKYIIEALAKNPEIKALQERVEAFRQRPVYEYALDDPMLRLGFDNLPTRGFSFREEDMTMKTIGLSQRFSYGGKRGLRRDMALREAEAAEKELEDRKNGIVRDVKLAYLDLAFTNKNIGIIVHHQDLLRQIIRIAEVKYSVGTSPQQDVLKAQVGLSQFIDDEIMLRQKKETAQARLSFLTSRQPGESPFEEPRDITRTAFSQTLDELHVAALESRPVLKAAVKMIERAEANLALKKRDYYPDFEVGMSYSQRDERDDMVSAMLTVNLPVWKKEKLDPKSAEAQAEIRLARAQYDGMKNEVVFMLRDLTAEIRRAERQMQLFDTGILPQARQSLKSAIAGYQVGKVDFFFLQDTQLNLFDFELKYLKARTEYEQKLAELEFVVGKRMF